MENQVKQVGLGVQHVVILTTASTDPASAIPQLDRSTLAEKLEMPQAEEIID